MQRHFHAVIQAFVRNLSKVTWLSTHVTRTQICKWQTVIFTAHLHYTKNTSPGVRLMMQL